MSVNMNLKVQKYLIAESNNNVDVKSKISRFGSPEQVWKFTRKEDGSYKITNCKNKLALDSTETIWKWHTTNFFNYF